jgi:hypothetical protein
MDMDDDRFSSSEWFDSLAFGEKEIVDEVMDNLSYEEWAESHIGEPESIWWGER